MSRERGRGEAAAPRGAVIAERVKARDLTLEVAEAQEALDAIRGGEVDALVVNADGRPQVFILKGADEAHRILLETLSEGAMTVAADGTILYANRRLADLVARPLDKVLGESLRTFVAARDQASFDALLCRAAHGRSKGELTLSTTASEVPVMASMSVIGKGQTNPTFTVVLTDLSPIAAAQAALQHAKDELEAAVARRTEELSRANEELREEIAARVRLEDELRRKAHELVEADRRKDEFLSMLAHELRNPLTPIVSAAEMIRLVVRPDPALERYRAIIDRQARNLARIVDDLLDVSRVTRRAISLHRERVDLRALIQSAVEAARPLLDAAEHSLALCLPDRAVALEVDRTRMEQVLVNLLNNAAKYTDRGGHITVSAVEVGPEVEIQVRDDGVGISGDLLPRVFDLFVQGDRSLDRSGGGLGIGLTMVKRLVEMHGGSVSVESAGPGQGTMVMVRLPAAGEPAVAARPYPASVAAPHRRHRVLVVEDNADVGHMLCEMLTLWGHDVCHARDGEEALRLTGTHRPTVALVDIGLPGMDGYEVARRLRRGPAEALTLICVSGYGQERDRELGRAAGFDHQLLKPPDPEALRVLLERVGAGGGP